MNRWANLDPRRIPSHLDPENVLLVFRERILQTILLGMAVLSTAGYIAALFISIQRQLWVLAALYTIFYVIALSLALYRRLQYHFRAGVVLLMVYLLGLSSLIESGRSADGRVFLLALPILSGVFLGRKASYISSAISIVTLIAIGMLMTGGLLPLPPLDIMASTGNALDRTTETVIFITLTLLVIFSSNELTRGFESNIKFQNKLAADLRREQARLEERVKMRTQELERRASQMEAASQLAHSITTATSLDALLDTAANLIQSRFGYEYAGIYLVDEPSEFADLRAASGSAGRAMLRIGHRVKVDETSLIGSTICQRDTRNTPDVLSDPFYFKNSLLPDIRSELALPLQTGGEILGALDVKSCVVDDFSQDDIGVLITIADQIAVAVEKARLVEQLQSNLADVRESYQDQVNRNWRLHLVDTKKVHAYRLRQSAIESGVIDNPFSQKAFDTGQLVLESLVEPETGKKYTLVSLPVRIREQVIGVLDIRLDYPQAPQDLIELLEATTQRMALALENARLLESIRVRAERERTVANISAQVRSATDIDTILRTAAQELGRSMGVSEVTVQLRSDIL
jgi:GAF domain-containing protein